MTIDLSFFHEEKLVVCVNMTASNFYAKVCAEISDEELESGDMVIIEDEKTGEEIFTDKMVIRKFGMVVLSTVIFHEIMISWVFGWTR